MHHRRRLFLQRDSYIGSTLLLLLLLLLFYWDLNTGLKMGMTIMLNNQAPLSYSWRETRVLLTNHSRGDLNLKTWFCIQKQSPDFLTPVSQSREGSLDSAFVSTGSKLPLPPASPIS